MLELIQDESFRRRVRRRRISIALISHNMLYDFAVLDRIRARRSGMRLRIVHSLDYRMAVVVAFMVGAVESPASCR